MTFRHLDFCEVASLFSRNRISRSAKNEVQNHEDV